MNLIRSKLFDGVTHGFGMAGFPLSDYCEGVSFKTNQMHGDKILRITSHDSRTTLLEADAFITNESGIICFVRTADCVPILMYDPVNQVVAAVHAGWKGAALKITAKTIERMEKEFGSKRKNVIAAIGPAIGGDCYEVGEDVFDAIVPLLCKEGRGEVDIYPSRPPLTKGRRYVNLPEINRRLLLESGVLNIDIIPICNHCDARFASYRRDRSEERRQVNFICLK